MKKTAWHPDVFEQRKAHLDIRQKVLSTIRVFFAARAFAEVDTPILQASPGNEIHLQTFATDLKNPNPDEPARHLYLQTSPEFAMKKLLVAGVPRLYQIAHVFRNGERSSRHHPEFSMLEWYRAKEKLQVIQEDCCALIRSIAEACGRQYCEAAGLKCDLFEAWETITVADAFQRYADIDLLSTAPNPMEPNVRLLAEQARRIGVRVAEGDRWDDLFFRILGERIEPCLGKDRPTFLSEYPASQAVLARLKDGRLDVAERFELYICGIELANAFGELTDADEQERRFTVDMDLKEKIYGERTPVDRDFLDALHYGMPESSGIALGVDRLVMLMAGADHIEDVLWLPVT